MESTISFDLVSPEKLVFNDKVGMVIIPGKEGDIGILPGHSKLLSSIRPGRIMVYNQEKTLVKSYFVSNGFVEIKPEKCIVLAEEISELGDLDKNEIEKQIEELKDKKEDESKHEYLIAKSKIEALNSSYYKKI